VNTKEVGVAMWFRWLGVVLFLGSSIFAESLVLDSVIIEKDGVVDNVRELNDLFREHQAQYTPIAPPIQSLFVQDYNLVIPARFDQLPENFTRQIIGTLNEDLIPLYKITVYEDPKTQQSVFLNDEGVELYRLDAPPTYSPLTWQREHFQLDETKILDPWTSWIFSSAHISASMTLVPVEFYETYILAEEQRQLDVAKELVPMMQTTEPTEGSMIVSVQAVSVAEDDGAEVPMMAMASFPSLPGGTVTNTTGSSGSSNQLMQLTFTPPAGFGNYAEIFRTTSLIPTNWSVVLNSQAVTSGVETTWIDYASSNQATGYFIISDATDDQDFDGFSDLREFYITHTSYTNFNFSDSDSDGLHDWFETIYFGSITNQTGTNDFDADGLMNNQEWILTSNSVTVISDPTVFDTDGDGTGDGQEVSQGSDPSNPSDNGQAPTNATTAVTLSIKSNNPYGNVMLSLVIGTNTYSVSAIKESGESFGVDSTTFNVEKGSSGTFTLSQDGDRNYDETFEYEATITGDGIIKKDPLGVLGVHFNIGPDDIGANQTGAVHIIKIQTQTIATAPVDRTRKTIGVGEEVKLTVKPSILSPISWSLTGSGTLLASPDASAIFTASDIATNSTITATYGGQNFSVTFTIIKPTGVLFENDILLGANVADEINDWYNLYYSAKVYVQPDAVNFENIKLYEGAAPPETEGYFDDKNIPNHDANGGHEVFGYEEEKGSSMKNTDFINMTAKGSPYSDGTLTWNIDWSYTVGDGEQIKIETVHQIANLNIETNKTTFTLTKDASGVYIDTEDEEGIWIE